MAIAHKTRWNATRFRGPLLEFLGYVVIAGALLFIPWYLQTFQPIGYVAFVAEDGWSEFTTFVLWMFVTLLLGYTLVARGSFRKPGHFVFAFGAFVMAMEEISWGQRLFDFSTPGLLEQINVQGEASLHNLADASLLISLLVAGVVAAAFVLPLLASIFPIVNGFCERWGIPRVSPKYWPLFAVAIYFPKDWRFGVFAIGFGAELMELSLAVAVLATTWGMTVEAVGLGQRRGAVFGGTLVLLGAGVIAAAPLVAFFPSQGSWRFATDWLAKHYPERAMYEQAATVQAYVVRYPKLINEYSIYRYVLLLQRLGRNEIAGQLITDRLRELTGEQPPATSEQNREAGRFLHLLGKLDSARAAYRKALLIDRQGMSEELDADRRAAAHWSMGKTLWAMRQKRAAEAEIKLALTTAESADLRDDINSWLNRIKRFERKTDLIPETLPLIRADAVLRTTTLPAGSNKGGTGVD